LEADSIGLVGPVTNRAGNEAQIDAPYRTYGEFLQFAHDHSRKTSELFNLRTLTMFCVAMRREVYQRIGPLDERFEVGMFEDDDYSMRMREAGYRVVCAEKVFVHHFGQASIGELALTGDYGELFHANRRKLEDKWGITWEPHRKQVPRGYRQLTDRIREVVSGALPSGATVIVISKGDGDLLELNGRRGWHFPQTEEGAYAGFYPSDSEEAIAHLESLRERGGEFLLIPHTALWWLDHYVEFGRHLKNNYREVVNQDDACLIIGLHERTNISGLSIRLPG
jgi:hypothetical protein